MQFDEQIDEGVSQLLRRDLARLGVNGVVFRLQDLRVPLHQRIGHGFLVRKETVERADFCIGPSSDLRHRCGLKSPLLDDRRSRVDELGDALATNVALRFQWPAIPA